MSPLARLGNLQLLKVAVNSEHNIDKRIGQKNTLRYTEGRTRKQPCHLIGHSLWVTPSGKSSNQVWRTLGEDQNPAENTSDDIVLKIRPHSVT